MPDRLTPKYIFELAEHDPVVHSVVELWMDGRMSWEQALIYCISIMSGQIDDMQKTTIRKLSETPFPFVLEKPK